MLVGLKINTRFIINCVPEREVKGYFVMSNLKECLHELDFNVRGFVSDNHSSNYGIDSPDLLISTITKDCCFRLMILKSLMTEFVFLRTK